jgi:predicted O-methyltransferase YrrM
MKSLFRFMLNFLPVRYKHEIKRVYSLFRLTSGQRRAFCDLFMPPFRLRVESESGLGEAVYLLFGLCRAMQPETVVEIGTARGYSTYALALACQQNGRGKVYGIDPHEPNRWTDGGPDLAHDNYEFLLAHLKEYELAPTWCEVIRARSLETSQWWDKPIDLLFIDGDHTYEGVKGDFEAFLPWLREDSVVVFHDSMWPGGVPRFLEELRQHGYHSVSVNVGPGLTLLSSVVGGVPFLPDGHHRKLMYSQT